MPPLPAAFSFSPASYHVHPPPLVPISYVRATGTGPLAPPAARWRPLSSRLAAKGSPSVSSDGKAQKSSFYKRPSKAIEMVRTCSAACTAGPDADLHPLGSMLMVHSKHPIRPTC